MNTRWKSLFLAIFSACLLAGSVNARVCFLADGKCNDMQLRPVAVGEDCEFNKNDRSCRLPKRAGGESCIRNGTVYYEKCVCPESYKYEVDASDEVYDYTSGKNRPASVRTCDGKTMYKVCKDKYPYVVEDAKNVNDRLDSNIYHPVENCSGGSSVDEDSDSCEEIGLGIKRYSGCLCNYLYTEEDIKGYEGLVSLGGKTCVVDGVIHYETLTCTNSIRNGFYYRNDCADDEELISAHNFQIIDKICYACKAPKTCEEMSMFKDETSCKQSGSHIKCESDSKGCWQVTGCETTSLGYQQTLVDHYNCYDNKLGCAAGDPNCYKECACIKGGVDENPQDCNVVYNNQGTATQPICELDCTSLGYKQCDRRQHWVATDAYDYCIGDITDDKPNKADNYYRQCERKNQCFPLFEDDPRFYWDDSGVGYCEMVLEIEEDDKWTTDGNPSPDGYWKGKTYSDDKAEYWLNNGYYHADRCVPLKGTDDVDETNRHLRLHHCESEDADCAGNLSDVIGRKTTLLSTSKCLNENDGRKAECGGKEYVVDCQCTSPTTGFGEVVEIPSDAKQGDFFNKLTTYAMSKTKGGIDRGGIGGGIFTGEIVEGCEGFEKRLGYRRAMGTPDQNNKRFGGKIYDITNPSGTFSVCSSSEICDGPILATERTFDGSPLSDPQVICDGTCVTPQTCTDDQMCTEVMTNNDGETVCTKCENVTVKCDELSVCTEPKTDKMGKEYCDTECISKCQDYINKNELDISFRKIGTNTESVCYVSHNVMFRHYLFKQFKVDGVTCSYHQDCKKARGDACSKFIENTTLLQYGNESNLPDKDTAVVPDNYVVCDRIPEGADRIYCGNKEWSDKCCRAAGNNERWALSKGAYDEFLSRGWISSSYEEDLTDGCYIVKCDGSIVDKDSKEYCCPNAKDAHTVVAKVMDWDIDVTNEYGPDIPEVCKYVEKQEVSCGEFDGKTKQDNQCYRRFAQGEADTDNYYLVFGPYYSISSGGVTAYNCSDYYKCSEDECRGVTSPIKGAKTAEELCGEGKVPDSSGLISECGGRYYKADTQCVCPDLSDKGYYQNKTEGSESYYVGELDIEGCEYYASCDQHPYTPEDGWKENPCEDPLKPATDAEKKTVCGKTYYAPNTKCVCPEKPGCFVTQDTSSVNWDKNYEVSKSNGCTYYAACDSLTTDCEGKYSPTYGRTMYTEQECIDAGTEPEGDVVVLEGVCGGPYYAGCKSVKQ